MNKMMNMKWRWSGTGKHISKDDRGSWEEKEGEGEDEKETGGGHCQEGCCQEIYLKFILMWFLCIKTTHSHPNLSLIHSGSAGAKPLPRRRSALRVSTTYRCHGGFLFSLFSLHCSTPWKLLKTGWSPTGCTSIWRGLPPRGSWSLPGQSACCWQV